MKRKIWLWSSLVLVLTLSGTLALFHYWDSLRNETISLQQKRLAEIEMSHFEAEKGNQVTAAAQDGAARFNQFALQIKGQVESAADSKTLQQPAARPADLNFKKQAFAALAATAGWSGAALTDEQGVILAAAGRRSPAGSLAGTPAFRDAVRGHETVLALHASADGRLQLQATVPCLRPDGVLLGVLQADVALDPEQLAQTLKRPGFLMLLGSSQGQRLFGGAEGFPKYIGSLIHKTPQDMELMSKANARGYLKATWEQTTYLMGSTATIIPEVQLFALLEVTGLEKFVGARAAATTLFTDPVMLAGMLLLVLAGLGLMLVVSGRGADGVRKLNGQLNAMLEEGADLSSVHLQEGGELGKLADLINLMIERGPARATPGLAVAPDAGRESLSPQAEAELVEARGACDRLREEQEQLHQKIAELSQQNEELVRSAANAAPAAVQDPRQTTEFIQMEALVRDFKQASALRIEAIQNMSEDLKATLTVIKNYISSILSSEEGKITDSQQEFLGVVINRSARLERQINDLLDISHMESEEDQGAFLKTDLVAILQDVILNIQPQADTKQIHLQAEIQSPLPQVMINSDRLGQVFINLLQHALKITPLGGEVRIAATETLSDLVIKIRDGGASLTAEQAGNVFVSYNGTDPRSGPDLAGTGLRFPIVKRIVDFHHGSIMVRGLEALGNETVITLPKEEWSGGGEERRSAAALGAESDAQASAEAAPPGRENFFDLTAFMGQATATPPTEPGRVAGGEDNLTELLKDIENPRN